MVILNDHAFGFCDIRERADDEPLIKFHVSLEKRKHSSDKKVYFALEVRYFGSILTL